ncbi:MAG: exodeoxyribonuclease V subunit alpha [Immundisolibacterales bacterium]|nr:exodeoxyribonuclease V subunit alpha [Immundisolibacterales bacterium]
MTVPLLDGFLHAGHIEDIDRHFGAFAGGIDGRDGPEVALAAALASHSARSGHACLTLPDVAGRSWPDAGAAALPAFAPWVEALATSPAVARPGARERRPLVLDGQGRLYLERYWTAEHDTATGILRLASPSPSPSSPEPDGLEAALDRLFPKFAFPDERPRSAARAALRRRLCVVTGGPGTGKTTTVAAIVALLIELGVAAPTRIVLAAPTGKAAARLQEAVQREMLMERGGRAALATVVPGARAFPAEASTVHRLLSRARRGALPVDALVLDEASMVDLGLMARVLAALPERARLVLLGDASQLASVQPGSVFGDLCRAGRGSGPLASCVIELVHNWRFSEAGGTGRIAGAIRRGDADAVLTALRDPSRDAEHAPELHPLPDPAAFERLAFRLADERFAPQVRAARRWTGPPGDDASPVQAFRVLCAHRVGPFGAERFNRLVEQRLRRHGLVSASDDFYPGRPVLVTRNDPRTGLSNGDTGVVLCGPEGRGRVWFPELKASDGGPFLVSPARLPPHATFFALTVHRAQGSEYDEVAVVLGTPESRVATRELLYTAVTRARGKVSLHGSEDSVAAAVARVTERSSGLHDALTPA